MIQSDLIETLRPFDLRMLTYSALVLIVDNPGLNQSRLSQIMDIERPNLVVIIDELEERELITESACQRTAAAMRFIQQRRVAHFIVKHLMLSHSMKPNCYRGSRPSNWNR